MITTDTVVGGAIGPADEELDLYAARVPSWLPLTVPGLPSAGTLPGFGTPGGTRPRGATDLTDPLERLAAELRNDLAMHPTDADADDREPIVLDRTVLDPAVLEPTVPDPAVLEPTVLDGTVLEPTVLEGPAEVSAASAGSLEAVLRFTAATEELASVRGRSASLAGRFGPEAVERASAQLTAVFERSVGAGAVPPHWTAPAVVRPLARIGSSGGGLVLDLPRRLLDEEFGAGGIMRFEEVDFPSTLTHEPTRRFLRETGLPENGGVFELDTEAPLRTLAEYWGDGAPGDFSGWGCEGYRGLGPEDDHSGGHGDDGSGYSFSEGHGVGGSGDFSYEGHRDGGVGDLADQYRPDRRPSGSPADRMADGADRLIRLGQLTGGAGLVLDGATGEVLARNEADLTLRRINADVSTLAFTLWLLHRVRSLAPTGGRAGSYAGVRTGATPALTAAGSAAGVGLPVLAI
ncbi:SUKH-4 family immunity protein [Streptomyces sp. NPDC054842]